MREARSFFNSKVKIQNSKRVKKFYKMLNVKSSMLNVRSELLEATGKMLTINSGCHNKDMQTTYMIFEMNRHRYFYLLIKLYRRLQGNILYL